MACCAIETFHRKVNRVFSRRTDCVILPFEVLMAVKAFRQGGNRVRKLAKLPFMAGGATGLPLTVVDRSGELLRVYEQPMQLTG